MTDREILIEAAKIMQQRGDNHNAAWLEWEAERCDPELPVDCVEVRLAIAVNSDGHAGHSSCVPGTVGDDDLMEMAESEMFGPTIAAAFTTLRIPRRQIPEVTGVVEEVVL